MKKILLTISLFFFFLISIKSVNALEINMEPWIIWSFSIDESQLPSDISVEKVELELKSSIYRQPIIEYHFKNNGFTPFYVSERLSNNAVGDYTSFAEFGLQMYVYKLEDNQVFEHYYEFKNNKGIDRYKKNNQLSKTGFIINKELLNYFYKINPWQKEISTFEEIRPKNYKPPRSESYEIIAFYGEVYSPITITIEYQLNPHYNYSQNDLDEINLRSAQFSGNQHYNYSQNDLDEINLRSAQFSGNQLKTIFYKIKVNNYLLPSFGFIVLLALIRLVFYKRKKIKGNIKKNKKKH